MTCEICAKPVRDRRKHRHRAAREEVRVAEEYGRLVASQEREMIRYLLKAARAQA